MPDCSTPLQQEGADLIDDAGPLTDQALADAQGLEVKLIGGLGCYDLMPSIRLSLACLLAPLAQAPLRRTWRPYASGNAISQVSPLARQSKRTSPLSWLIIFSIMRVPNPRCVGGVTVGPPDSTQRKLSLPSAEMDHAILA